MGAFYLTWNAMHHDFEGYCEDMKKWMEKESVDHVIYCFLAITRHEFMHDNPALARETLFKYFSTQELMNAHEFMLTKVK